MRGKTLVQRLLEQAEDQAKKDICAVLEEPAQMIVNIISARTRQMLDPDFERQKWREQVAQDAW